MVEGFKDTEIGILPIDWNTYQFGEISYMKGRIGWQGLNQTEFTMNPDQPFLITGMNFKDGEIRWNEVYHVPEDRYEMAKEIQLKIGDVLLTKDGTIGKLLYVRNIPYPHKATLNSHLLVFRPIDNSYDPLFLYYNLSSSFFKSHIELFKSGTTFFGISQDAVSKYIIPLPPTKVEQTAIATALNDADALITQLEKLIAKKKAMKQGAVQELFKAKKGWQTKSLGDITNIRRGASPRPIKDPKWFSQKGRGWIRISDVTSSNVYLNSTTQYLSEEGVKYSVPVDKGDLIMSICATIGVPVIINIPACIHDGFVLFSNYENNLDTFYLYFFLQKETDALVGKGQPGTQKNLNISIVSNIEISYPSVEEQKKIGLILKDIDIELSGLEQRLEKQKQLKQGMMQSLLTGKIRLV